MQVIPVFNKNILDVMGGMIVIPVNEVGVMGKGLALQAAKRYPDLEMYYKSICRTGEFKDQPIDGWEQFILFKTKKHWREKSSYDLIIAGLYTLKELIIEEVIMCDIYMPKIGCGLGGLDWKRVKYLIHTILSPIDTKLKLYIYE